jgi:hypothetical protein
MREECVVVHAAMAIVSKFIILLLIQVLSRSYGQRFLSASTLSRRGQVSLWGNNGDANDYFTISAGDMGW